MPPTTAEQQAAAAKKYNLLYAGSFFMLIAAVCNWIGMYWLFSMAQEVRCSDQCFSDNSRQQLLPNYRWGYYPGYYPYYSGWVQTHEDEIGFGSSFIDLHNHNRRLEASLVQSDKASSAPTIRATGANAASTAADEATTDTAVDAPLTTTTADDAKDTAVADAVADAADAAADATDAVADAADAAADAAADKLATDAVEAVTADDTKTEPASNSTDADGSRVGADDEGDDALLDPEDDVAVIPGRWTSVEGRNCTNQTIPSADGMPDVTVCIPNHPQANTWWSQYLCDNGINRTANPSVQARQQQQVATLRASFDNNYFCFGRLFSDTDKWTYNGKRGWQAGLYATGVFAVLTSFFATFMCFLACAYGYGPKPREATIQRILVGGILGFITVICTMFSFTPILNDRYSVSTFWFVGWGICAGCWLVFVGCIAAFKKALPSIPNVEVRRVVAVQRPANAPGPAEVQPLVNNP